MPDKSKENESLKQDVRNSLAELYKMGNLEKSAIYYEQYGRNEKGAKAKAPSPTPRFCGSLGRESETPYVQRTG